MQSPPPRRHWMLWTGAAALILLLGATLTWRWFSAGSDSYSVNGLPLRQWLAEHPDFEVREPMAELGTNVLPNLTRILSRPPESALAFRLKQQIWNLLPASFKATARHLRPIPDWQVRRTALFAVRFLGPEAKAAFPQVVRIARTETNRMVRGSALVAALSIAPQAPQTFELWRDEWVGTNYFSRNDLAVYLKSPRVPIPEAVPYLLNEITNAHPQAARNAMEVFENFGDAAVPLLPVLISAFEKGGSAERYSLCHTVERLGPKAASAVPVLAASLRDQSSLTVTVYNSMSGKQEPMETRPGLNLAALRALGSIGPPAASALPWITPFFTNTDTILRMVAAATALRVGGPTNDSLPILLDGIHGRLSGPRAITLVLHPEEDDLPAMGSGLQETAVFLCGQVGPAALPALPAIKQMLTDNIVWIRISAAQAVWRMTHQAEDCLPVLTAVIDSAPKPNPRPSFGSPPLYELLMAINVIAEIGPAAEPALPSLARVRTFSMSTRHAVDKAVARIHSEPK